METHHACTSQDFVSSRVNLWFHLGAFFSKARLNSLELQDRRSYRDPYARYVRIRHEETPFFGKFSTDLDKIFGIKCHQSETATKDEHRYLYSDVKAVWEAPKGKYLVWNEKLGAERVKVLASKRTKLLNSAWNLGVL
jgi:hypothetical protein